jgi:hypothetical protein
MYIILYIESKLGTKFCPLSYLAFLWLRPSIKTEKIAVTKTNFFSICKFESLQIKM